MLTTSNMGNYIKISKPFEPDVFVYLNMLRNPAFAVYICAPASTAHNRSVIVQGPAPLLFKYSPISVVS